MGSWDMKVAKVLLDNMNKQFGQMKQNMEFLLRE